MALSDIVSELQSHFQTAKADAEAFLSDHLPRLAALAEHAAANPLIDAALAAVHLSPAVLAALADVIAKADADLAALAPAAPAEPQPADPAAPPA